MRTGTLPPLGGRSYAAYVADSIKKVFDNAARQISRGVASPPRTKSTHKEYVDARLQRAAVSALIDSAPDEFVKELRQVLYLYDSMMALGMMSWDGMPDISGLSPKQARIVLDQYLTYLERVANDQAPLYGA